jgi:hypothetical protein
MTKTERELRQLIKSAGLKLLKLSHSGSTHYKAEVEAADGRKSKFFFALTPSENRSGKNNLSMLRRFSENRLPDQK